jgi:uncharacterized protein
MADDEEQKLLHAAVAPYLGSIRGRRLRASRSKRFSAVNMGANFLIDTGAILAILVAKDRCHGKCLDTLVHLRLPAMTSGAVLTELFHLVKRFRTEMQIVWKFLGPGRLVIASIEQTELSDIRALMVRDADRPMDFADTTLVHLAGREGIDTILTVDQADFWVDRISGKRRPRVLPIERPQRLL